MVKLKTRGRPYNSKKMEEASACGTYLENIFLSRDHIERSLAKFPYRKPAGLGVASSC
jgi:hypothetical protein